MINNNNTTHYPHATTPSSSANSSFHISTLEGTEKKYTIEIVTVVRKKRNIKYAIAKCTELSPDTACVSGKEADAIIDNEVLPLTAYTKFLGSTEKKEAYVAKKKAQSEERVHVDSIGLTKSGKCIMSPFVLKCEIDPTQNYGSYAQRDTHLLFYPVSLLDDNNTVPRWMYDKKIKEFFKTHPKYSKYAKDWTLVPKSQWVSE